jgi:hypothetical protein
LASYIARSARTSQRVLEAAAVDQAGQRVVVGHVLQAFLVALALGDVLELGEQVQGAAVAVAHQRHVDVDPQDVPVGVDEPQLAGVAVALAAHIGRSASAARGRSSA